MFPVYLHWWRLMISDSHLWLLDSCSHLWWWTEWSLWVIRKSGELFHEHWWEQVFEIELSERGHHRGTRNCWSHGRRWGTWFTAKIEVRQFWVLKYILKNLRFWRLKLILIKIFRKILKEFPKFQKIPIFKFYSSEDAPNFLKARNYFFRCKKK